MKAVSVHPSCFAFILVSFSAGPAILLSPELQFTPCSINYPVIMSTLVNNSTGSADIPAYCHHCHKTDDGLQYKLCGRCVSVWYCVSTILHACRSRRLNNCSQKIARPPNGRLINKIVPLSLNFESRTQIYGMTYPSSPSHIEWSSH